MTSKRPSRYFIKFPTPPNFHSFLIIGPNTVLLILYNLGHYNPHNDTIWHVQNKHIRPSPSTTHINTDNNVQLALSP